MHAKLHILFSATFNPFLTYSIVSSLNRLSFILDEADPSSATFFLIIRCVIPSSTKVVASGIEQLILLVSPDKSSKVYSPYWFDLATLSDTRFWCLAPPSQFLAFPGTQIPLSISSPNPPPAALFYFEFPTHTFIIALPLCTTILSLYGSPHDSELP